MASRSHSFRIARALAKELQPTANRSLSSVSASSYHVSCDHKPLNYSNLSSSRSSLASLYYRSFSSKPEEATAAASDEAASEGESDTATEETASANDAPTEVDEGEDKITQLEAQIKDLKDQVLRSLAEQENTRRIAKRDVSNAKSFAITSFAKSLLDTSDNLSRALDAVPEELRHDHENHPVLANLYEGISMTDDGLSKAFLKNGLKKFGQKGEKFDPNLHEALFEYPDPEGEVGNIGQVMKVGFMLNDRVVRPAEVGVVKAP